MTMHHSWIVLLALLIWRYVLGKAELTAEKALVKMVSVGIRRLLGRNKMDQNIGSVGKASESYSKGVATASAEVALPNTSFGLTVSLEANVSLDAKVLIAFLATKVGGPVPAEVASFIEAALAVT